MRLVPILVLLAAASGWLNVQASGQTAVDATFTYQGQLKRGAVPVSDVCEFEFRLYTAESGGSQIGGTHLHPAVPVENGLFNVELNFGPGAFTGDQRFLQVAVECPGDGAPTILSPRHPLTATPYATTALSTLGVDGHSLDASDGSPTDAVRVDAQGKVLMNKGGLNVFDNVGHGISLTSDSFTFTEGTSEDPVYGYSSSTDTHAFYTNGNRQLVISDVGNVGIGMLWNQSPSAKMHIGGTAGIDGIMFPDGTLQTTAATGGGSSLWFASGSDVYYDAGNVGIGTNLPQTRLHILGPDEEVAVKVEVGGEGATGVETSTDGLGARSLDATATGPEANAIYARATGSDGIATVASAAGMYGAGVHASSSGRDAVAIRANANGETQVALEVNATGLATLNGYPLPNTGGQFYASGTGSVGVYGHVDEGSYGVHGRSDSSHGSGVYGEATTSGQNNGVYGTTASTNGRGVYGYATATSGSARGVYGRTESTTGVGVSGLASAATGTAAGVVGQTYSPDGYAGKFFGGRNYFEGNVGIGTESPAAKLHIGGSAGVDGLMFPDGTLQTTAATGGGSDLWTPSGSNIYYDGGNVGVGSTSTAHPLDVRSSGLTATLNAENTGTFGGTAIAATASTGNGATAVRAESSSTNGYAVYATNEAASGNAFAVYALSMSPTGIAFRGHTSGTNGYGLYLTGGRHYIGGNVGIGTSSPQAKLHIGGTPGTDGIKFPDGSLQVTAAVGGSGDSLWSDSDGDIFYTAGNVGIGTSSPAESLHVVGDTRLEGSVTIGDTSLAASTLGLVANGVYGIQAQTPNVIGAAIVGEATDADGLSFGVMGTSLNDGAGVYGSGTTTGVEGTSNAANGVGVYGHVDASTAGTGVYGSVGASGINYGVRGKSNSTSGFGGYFTNTSSDGTALYAESAGARTGDATLQVHNTQPVEGMAAYITADSTWATVHARNDGTGEVLWLAKNSTAGEYIVAYDEYYGKRVFSVDHDGWTKVSVLEITGGADLSEQFDVASDATNVEPGMVVSIDPENPGKLVVADRPYDYTVAGVVSGAGGVKPGMLMGQKGSMADGTHPIALTGRVWTRCDASNGAIKPGDLLTTSSVPGHAMKVTDRTKAQGAMIGKAMTSLEEGQGLVLVLVSLQ